MARPMPLEAPVTTATFLLNLTTLSGKFDHVFRLGSLRRDHAVEHVRRFLDGADMGDDLRGLDAPGGKEVHSLQIVVETMQYAVEREVFERDERRQKVSRRLIDDADERAAPAKIENARRQSRARGGPGRFDDHRVSALLGRLWPKNAVGPQCFREGELRRLDADHVDPRAVSLAICKASKPSVPVPMIATVSSI